MSRTAHWVVRKLPAGGSGWATVDRWQLSPNVGWTYGSIAEDVVAGPGGEVHVVGRGWANTSGTSSHYLTRSSTDGGVTWMTTDDHKPDAAANSSGWAIARDRDGNLLTAGTVGYSSGGSHLAVRTTAAATPIAVFATARISDPLLDDSLAADEIFA